MIIAMELRWGVERSKTRIRSGFREAYLRILARYALRFGAACALLAGCGGSQPPIGAPGVPVGAGWESVRQPTRSTRAREAGQTQTLFIGESSGTQGIVEIYEAPFTGRPRRLSVNTPIGISIAPNGDLIVADGYAGIYVFDPTFKHKRLVWRSYGQLNGQLLYDSKGRLFVPTQGPSIYVFDPPYDQKPILSFGVPANLNQVAIDKHDDVFVGTEATLYGNAPTYACVPPTYYPCDDLGIGNGAVALDSSDDLLTGTSHDEIAVYPPPYKRPKSKAKVPFGFYLLTRAAGATFLAGINDYGDNSFGAFPASLDQRLKRIPIEQYYIPGPSYSISRNAIYSSPKESTRTNGCASASTRTHIRTSLASAYVRHIR
jgi:hypothetical protein